MEIDRQGTLHAVSFVVVIVVLTAVCAGLVTMIVMSTQRAREAQVARGAVGAEEVEGANKTVGAKVPGGAKENYYYHMAWLSLALLALTILVLVWMVIHHVSRRLGRRSPRRTTEHVDAWALAGKRFKLEEDADEQEEPM